MVTATDPTGRHVSGEIGLSIFRDFDGDGMHDGIDWDDDEDGYEDDDDRFPFDPNEWRDNDSDGIGDNGDTDDDNDGVADGDDSFPFDEMCQEDFHNVDGVCVAEIIDNAKIVSDGRQTLFFLPNGSKSIYPWDTPSRRFLRPINLESGSAYAQTTSFTYSAPQQKMYIGYDDGVVTSVDASQAQPPEVVFYRPPGEAPRGGGRNYGLSPLGDHILIHLAESQYPPFHGLRLFNEHGQEVASKYSASLSGGYIWSDLHQREYFISESGSPTKLQYYPVDLANGIIGDAVDSPYHDEYRTYGPLFLSADQQLILTSPGNVYYTDDMTWAASIPKGIFSAVWAEDGLITLRGVGNIALLERRNNAMEVVETVKVIGQPLALTKTQTGYQIIVSDYFRAQIIDYLPSDDTDNDGVGNLQDDFPQDASASVDTDNDGHPDSWNAGYSATDSTSGLTLDAFPEDAACFEASQAVNGMCEIHAPTGYFVTDAISDGNDTLYFLTSFDLLMYRWSFDSETFLPPIAIGDRAADIKPKIAAYSAETNRMYFGYTNGMVTVMDLGDANPREEPFAAAPDTVNGLAMMGNHVLVQSGTGYSAKFHVYTHEGNLTDTDMNGYYSVSYAWNENLDRLYYFHNDFHPDDLLFSDIDTGTGKFIGSGESPYHAEHSFFGDILLSPDSSQVVSGEGVVFSSSSLLELYRLSDSFQFGVWLNNGNIYGLKNSSEHGDSTLVKYEGGSKTSQLHDLTGDPIGIFSGKNKVFAVTEVGEDLAFTEISSAP